METSEGTVNDSALSSYLSDLSQFCVRLSVPEYAVHTLSLVAQVCPVKTLSNHYQNIGLHYKGLPTPDSDII